MNICVLSICTGHWCDWRNCKMQLSWWATSRVFPIIYLLLTFNGIFCSIEWAVHRTRWLPKGIFEHVTDPNLIFWTHYEWHFAQISISDEPCKSAALENSPPPISCFFPPPLLLPSSLSPLSLHWAASHTAVLRASYPMNTIVLCELMIQCVAFR